MATSTSATTASDAPPVVCAEGLTKIYTDFWGRPQVRALTSLTLRVLPGEIFAILGPNGCGKTTTMKLLLGLLFPTGGRAEVLGRPPGDTEAKRRIGFLPEESYFHRFLTADETLDFYGRIFYIPRAERRRRIDALLAQFGLEKARNRPIRGYSKGMARRVGFAQMLLNDPDLLFMDEPTSGLDPISAREIKNLILDLKRRGKTVFLSSHLLADVESVCDTIAILAEGRLQVAGTVRDLLTVRDHTTLTFRNLPAEAQREIEAVASRHGAALVESRLTAESLESLFLKTVQGKPPPGSGPG